MALLIDCHKILNIYQIGRSPDTKTTTIERPLNSDILVALAVYTGVPILQKLSRAPCVGFVISSIMCKLCWFVLQKLFPLIPPKYPELKKALKCDISVVLTVYTRESYCDDLTTIQSAKTINSIVRESMQNKSLLYSLTY